MYPNKNHFIFIISTILILSNLAFSQTVIKHPNPADKLDQRWEWALKEATARKITDSFWIGYNIQRLMSEKSYIGCFRSSASSDEKPLGEMIYGRRNVAQEKNLTEKEVIRDAAERALKKLEHKDLTEEKVLKDVAILFKFIKGTSTENIEGLTISNLSLYVDLDNKPLIWLDKAVDNESIQLLTVLYQDAKASELKEKLVSAVGTHEHSALTFAFLEKILKSDDPDAVREKAAFWMGQQDNEEAITILLKTAQNDRSEEVREKAVFGISQIGLDNATKALMNLAENGDDEDVRETAIFWLGQHNEDQALDFLKKIAKTDPATEVQEKAIFAISQMKSDAALDVLIDLAYHASDDGARKKAIFWLGQKASHKAVEALEALVKNDADIEVQKQAVFALTQLPNHQGVPQLIKIARTHPHCEVRKQAIFWLGQSDDRRAVDALVEIVRTK